MDNGRSQSKLNIPNLLTIVRIVCVPILVICLMEGRFGEAFMVFVIGGVSDALDGLLARTLHQKTIIGAILDPIADKLLLDSTFVVLAAINTIPRWLAVVVISRDVIIVAGVLILFLVRGSVRIKPTISSKLTTLIQLGTAFTVLLSLETAWFRDLLPILYAATGAITAVSGGQYLTIGFRILNANPES